MGAWFFVSSEISEILEKIILKIKSYIIQEEKAQLLLPLVYLKGMLLNKKN